MHVKQVYKDYIDDKLKAFQAYDDQRPADRTYRFVDHSKRVAESMKALAKEMGYKDDMVEALYYATLIHDIGKMELPLTLWDTTEKPTDAKKDERREHTLKGVEIIKRDFPKDWETDAFLKLTIDLMENHHEHIDGSGYLGKTRLSREVRMLAICDAFDGGSIFRDHYGDRDITPNGVITRMEVEKRGQYDHDILQIFKKVIKTCQSKSYSLLPLSS